jgi:septal ring factor EnvC (AmiA/AmiB activator)
MRCAPQATACRELLATEQCWYKKPPVTIAQVYVTHRTMQAAFLFLIAVLLAAPASAETSQDARKELSSTLSDIKASDARQKALEDKRQQIEEELKHIQSQTVGLAKDEGKQEEELSSYEDKLRILEEQKQQKTASLGARQKELSAMISAMIKLRSIPPQAIIAMPGKLDETLATARALNVVTHTIEEESASLKGQIIELEALQSKIHKSRDTITQRKSALEERRKQLSVKLDERTQLESELGGKEKAERERVAGLTAKSKSLQDLVDSLARSERSWFAERGGTASAITKHEKNTAGKMRSFAAAKGDIALPAAGKIISHYDNPKAATTFSKGIVIETRNDAQVVAPYDGEVVFAGRFRDYGRMVIIRHSNDFHTLLSGLGTINCTPGQFLIEGEPVGAMGDSDDGNRLYMELRKEGKPIDPSGWIKG